MLQFIHDASGEVIAVHAFPEGDPLARPGQVLAVTDRAGQVATWQVESSAAETVRLRPWETAPADDISVASKPETR